MVYQPTRSRDTAKHLHISERSTALKTTRRGELPQQVERERLASARS
jgi:hypothetical protein